MDTKNLEIYGSAPLPWTRVLRQLEAADSKKSHWLATTRPDGRPHVAGVGAVWLDGKFYFVSGAATRKSRNLAQNPNCVLSVSLADVDLVVEGTAAIVRDPSTLARLAERYASGGWRRRSGMALSRRRTAPQARARHRGICMSSRP